MLAVISCPVETGTSNQSAILGDGADLSQSEINKQASRKRNDIENIGGVLTTSEISEVNVLSKEESSFTFDIRPLGGQSMGETGKGLQSFPRIKACKMSLVFLLILSNFVFAPLLSTVLVSVLLIFNVLALDLC